MEDATAAAQSTNLISFQSALQNGLIDWNEVVEELGRPFAAFDVGWPTQQSKGNLRRNQHKSIKEIDWICLLIEGWAERNCWLGCLIEWVGYGRLAANGSAQEEQTTTPTNQRKGMNFASPTAISLSEWSEEKRCGGGRKKQSEWSTKQPRCAASQQLNQPNSRLQLSRSLVVVLAELFSSFFSSLTSILFFHSVN